MTQWNGHSDLAELAQLPPTHPDRAKLEAQLALMEPAVQQRWRGILWETDALHLELARVHIPIDLEERLLLIPASRAARPGRWQRILAGTTNWKSLAAGLLIAVGVLAYIFWPTSAPPPSPLQALDAPLADKIATLAIQHCQGQASLEISSSDAGKVLAVLASHHLPITAAVRAPRPNFVLVGGGACDFGGGHALYTSWHVNNQNYTLFQFNGKDLCVPSAFLKTMTTPTLLGKSMPHDRVVIWPGDGQTGDWVLVLQGDAAQDAYMQSCR
jgi:hypothetical protein